MNWDRNGGAADGSTATMDLERGLDAIEIGAARLEDRGSQEVKAGSYAGQNQGAFEEQRNFPVEGSESHDIKYTY